MDSQNHQFTKIFDVLNTNFHNWFDLVFGLVLLLLIVAIVFFPKLIKSRNNFRHFDWRKNKLRNYSLAFIIGAVFLSLLSGSGLHTRHKALAQNNSCTIVEGPVKNFIPMPYTGHSEETFSVSGVQFGYSDFIETDAFNNTSSHGGPINRNSYVRICYDPQDHAILRLEILDEK